MQFSTISNGRWGYPICSNKECKTIYKDILDHSPEWRFYKSEDRNSNDPTRCGNPINPLLVESSYGLKVLSKPGSSYEMKKIKDGQSGNRCLMREKALFEEFQFSNIDGNKNAGIPKIFIDHAITIHKDISEQQMFRGMNRDGIKAASIYLSCRLNGCPRTAHEMEIFKLDKTSATNGCSMAVKYIKQYREEFR